MTLPGLGSRMADWVFMSCRKEVDGEGGGQARNDR